MVQKLEKNLQQAFKDSPQENRILDIWIDLPSQIVNNFVKTRF